MIVLEYNRDRFEDQQYHEFLRFCEITDDGEHLVLAEGRITDFIKDVVEFVKSLGTFVGLKTKELFQLFKNKVVFNFFKYFKFSIKKIIEIIKGGYTAYKKVIGFFPELIAKLAVNSKGFKWTKDKLDVLNKWLKDHKWVARLSGVALAGLLLVIWLNMSFTGDFGSDMDFSDILSSLTGRYTIFDFLTSEGGIKTLILLGTGVLGASFTWFKTPVNIMLALVSTLAKKFRVRLQKGT